MEQIIDRDILFNRCTLWYNIHGVHKLLHVSVSSSGSYYKEGVQTNLPIYVLFFLIKKLKCLIVKIRKFIMAFAVF